MNDTIAHTAVGPKATISNAGLPDGPSVATEASERAETPGAVQDKPRNSLGGLVRNLTQEVKSLVRQELKLAKAELSEKAQYLTRNSVALVVGGVIAYAGLIVLLLGLGFLVAWAIHLAGIQGLFASFLGLLFVGMSVAGLGGALVLKGISAFRQESLAPERTLSTLKDLKGTKNKTGAHSKLPTPPEPKVSSQEMQQRVEATEVEMGETLDELTHRLDPRRLNAKVKNRIQERPFKSSLIAMGAGLVSGFLLRGRSRNSA